MTFDEILKNIREILCSSLFSKLSEYLIFKTRKKSYLKTKKPPSTQHFKYDNIKNRHIVILQNATCRKCAPHPTNLQPSKPLKTIGITTAHPPLAVSKSIRRKGNSNFIREIQELTCLKKKKV